MATVRLWLEFGEPAPMAQSLDLAIAALYGIISAYRGDDWRGFSAPSAFARWFRQQFRTSPSQWRERAVVRTGERAAPHEVD